MIRISNSGPTTQQRISKLMLLVAAVTVTLALVSCYADQERTVEANVVSPDVVQRKVDEESNMAQTTNASNVHFSAELSGDEKAIKIKYKVTNGSKSDIYLLDALPGSNKGVPYVEENQYFLSVTSDTAIVLKGILPLPIYPVVARIMPLATKIVPGAVVEREVILEYPLRERNDWYYPPLAAEKYKEGSIDNIEFRVQVLSSDVEGFSAVPSHISEKFFEVHSTSIKQVETFTSQFRIGPTKVLVRPDIFSRL